MSMSDKEARAAAYALGALDRAEQDAVADELRSDQELSGQVDHWEMVLAPLALDLPVEPAPEGLFSAIEAKIDRPTPRLPGMKTIREADGRWIGISDGVEMKMLHKVKDGGRKSFLLRLAPGAKLDTHPHDQDEECYVIEGDISFGDLELQAGDYHVASAGTPHPESFSRNGCLLFITGAL